MSGFTLPYEQTIRYTMRKGNMYLKIFDSKKSYSAIEIRDLAAEVKAEIKRVENLRDWLSSCYRPDEYIMIAIKEYLSKAVNTQYAISRQL